MKFFSRIKEGVMKESREEKKEEKRVYEKPALTRYGKLTDMVAEKISPTHMLGCSRGY